jgi:hypothetical protein
LGRGCWFAGLIQHSRAYIDDDGVSPEEASDLGSGGLLLFVAKHSSVPGGRAVALV